MLPVLPDGRMICNDKDKAGYVTGSRLTIEPPLFRPVAEYSLTIEAKLPVLPVLTVLIVLIVLFIIAHGGRGGRPGWILAREKRSTWTTPQGLPPGHVSERRLRRWRWGLPRVACIVFLVV